MSHPNNYVDTVNILNLDEDVSSLSTISAMDLITQDHVKKESFIVSSADHELLILISFKDALDLKSVKIHSFDQNIEDEDVSCPKQVNIYKINNLSVNFDDLSSMKPDKTVTCNAKKLCTKGQVIHLQKSPKNAVQFNQIKYLAIYIDSNQNDTEITVLNAISFKTNVASNSSSSPITLQTSTKQSMNPSTQCASNAAQCDHVNDALKCLQLYQSLDISNNESDRDLMTKRLNGEYKTFLDDYIHMMMRHNHEIDAIHDIIASMTNINECVLSTCTLASRHHRDRKEESKEPNDMAPEVLFWRDTLDACHCYLFHLYDFGLRMKMKHQKQPAPGAHFVAICDHLKALKVQFTRYEQNKFVLQGSGSVEESDETFMDGLHEFLSLHFDKEQTSLIQKTLADEEYDTESIEMDMETNHYSNIRQCCGDNDHMMDSISDAFNRYTNNVELLQRCFQIGYAFNYWTNYQLPTDQGPMCIKPKYTSLKEEIQNNSICQLTRDQLNQSVTKAYQLLQTSQAKATTAFRYPRQEILVPRFQGWCRHADIKKGTPLSVDNILCLVLYTDWSELSTQFSATFRSKTPFETITFTKNRNREFAVWSRLMRETIPCFGDMGNMRHIDGWNECGVASGPFFCGISSVVAMPSFNIELQAPTSTTSQLEVAVRFAGEYGITIQLNNNGHLHAYRIPSWDCSWLSNYPGEDERLWMGGSALFGMKLETVRIIGKGANFDPYFKALFYLDCMLTSNNIQGTQKPTSSDYLMLYELINTSKAPKYVQKTLESYTKNKTDISIDMGRLEFFGKLNELIVDKRLMKEEREKCNIEFKPNGPVKFNLLKPIVFKPFHNLQALWIETSLPYGNGVAEYEMDLFSLLPLLDLSPTLNYVKIVSMRQHIIRGDKHNVVQDVQHTGPSWLGLYWKQYWLLLTKQYGLQEWQMTYAMTTLEQAHETVFKMYYDNIYIMKDQEMKRWRMKSSIIGLLQPKKYLY
eukprot:821504_1